MAALDREERYQHALSSLKWWAELVGILSAWAVMITATIILSQATSRFMLMVDLGVPKNSPIPTMMWMSMLTFYMFLFWTGVVSLRIFWLIYCWISRFQSDGDWMKSIQNIVLATAFGIMLFGGVFTVAIVIASSALDIQLLSRPFTVDMPNNLTVPDQPIGIEVGPEVEMDVEGMPSQKPE